MLFAFALIPVIILLIFIYKRDKKEKEPGGLLVGLFFAGMATTVSAVIIESLGGLIVDAIFPYENIVKTFVTTMLIVGPAEELGKYVVLRLITWKNKNFNYSYDAIVYAVFVSLGFACLENVLYVLGDGWTAAIMRMFTAIPGHASFAVIMGYFYSKAKYADITGNKSDKSKNIALAIVIPMIIHGLYDGIILSCVGMESLYMIGSTFLLWIAFVIILFVLSFIAVIKASKNDFCIVTLPDNVQTVYRPTVAGEWICSCGSHNMLNYCSVCGQMRPINTVWYCPQCNMPSAYNFCGNCGCHKPQ